MQCIAPWIPAFKSGLATQLEDDKFIHFTLSTLDSEKMVPHCRTCIYRGFLFGDESTNSIVIATDNRSKKFKELRKCNNFEACFYFKKTHKQFRLQGKASIISLDSNTYPDISLPDIQNTPYGGKEDDEVELEDIQNEPEEQEEQEEQADPYRVKLHRSESTASVFQTINQSNNNSTKQSPESFNYPIYSPSSMAQIQNCLEANPSISLNELLMKQPSLLYPPTVEDYNNEFGRVWDLLSSKTKSSFKNPMPKSLLTEDKRKTIDRINRGVDGVNINDGKKHLCVIVLSVNKVDFFKDSYGNSKRLLYERVNFDQWKESEVVP